MALSSVRAIPNIMRAKGWNTAAFLLDTWFSRSRYVRAEPVPRSAPPNNEISNALNFSKVGGLAWIKNQKAGKETYDKIFNEKLWRTFDDKKGNAQSKLATILRREGILNPSANNTKFGYKNWAASDYEINNYAVNASTYATGNDKAGIFFGGITEIVAALGSFTLKFALNGTLRYEQPWNPNIPVVGHGGKYFVKPESVTIYLWDLFDFEGDQPLGAWNETNNDVRAFSIGGGYVDVDNASFRAWREANNMGGDYWIYTEPVTVQLNDKSEFEITKFV
jgi:Family of unknown function (DUF6402)